MPSRRPTTPRASKARARLALAAIVLSLPLAACGGGKGPGDGPGGGGGGGFGTASIHGAVFETPMMLPGQIAVTFDADADSLGTVTFFLDRDGSLATPGDQLILTVQADTNGATQLTNLVVPPPLPSGDYTLFLRLEDTVNPPLHVAHGAPIRIAPALAGLAQGQGSNRYAVQGDVIAFSRSEAADGFRILNGDAISDGDAVIALLDVSTLQVRSGGISVEKTANPGSVAEILPARDGVFAWGTLEQDENVSVDGDGSTADRLLTTWRVVDNAPIRNDSAGLISIQDIVGGLPIAIFSEPAQGPGGTDRNGPDGDVGDAVAGYLDPSAVPTPPDNALVFWRMAADPGIVRTSGTGLVGFAMSEAGQGNADVTADGDAGDHVLVLGDMSVPAGTPGGATGAFLTFAGPLGAARPIDQNAAFDVERDGTIQTAGFYVDEADVAGGDANFDAFTGYAPAFWRVAPPAAPVEVLILPPSAGLFTAPPGEQMLFLEQGQMAFVMQEGGRADGSVGTNGDGDNADQRILMWTDTSVGAGAMAQQVSMTGVANAGGLSGLALDGGSAQQLAPGWIGLHVQEQANGGVDLNGNAQIDDAFLLLELGATPPQLHNPRLRTLPAAVGGTVPITGRGGDSGVVLRVAELFNGNLDGDGNATELLFVYVDFGAPSTRVVLDAGGDHASVHGGRIGVTAIESNTGEDYSGDGQADDVVFRLFAADGSVLHAGTLSTTPSVPTADDGSLWAFLRSEAAESRDMNDDGDVSDLILGFLEL